MRPFFAFLALLCLAQTPLPAHASQTVTDDLGRRVFLAHPPKHILSLAPSVTEILFAVGAGDKIAGDTIYCDFPPAARTLPHVGGPITPSAEKIQNLRPDLIILAEQGLPPARADALAAHWRAPVYVTAAATYAQVEQDITDLGALAGSPKATADTLARMRAAQAVVRRAVRMRPRPRVFVVVWNKPLMTAGGSSFIGDLLRLDPAVRPYFIAAHRSPEPGHAILLESLGLPPLLDLGLRLGESSGAAFALPLVRLAVAVLRDVATFEEANVSDRGEGA